MGGEIFGNLQTGWPPTISFQSVFYEVELCVKIWQLTPCFYKNVLVIYRVSDLLKTKKKLKQTENAETLKHQTNCLRMLIRIYCNFILRQQMTKNRKILAKIVITIFFHGHSKEIHFLDTTDIQFFAWAFKRQITCFHLLQLPACNTILF